MAITDYIALTTYDIIYNNAKKIHNKLFNDAIDKYCLENNKNKDDYKIIDQQNKENVFKPSIAIFINSNSIDYIDLTEYWNMNYITELQSYSENNLFKELLISDENKKYIDVEYIDYVNGKVQFKNKFTNKKFYVKFNKLDISKNYNLQLKNTFTSLYYDKR